MPAGRPLSLDKLSEDQLARLRGALESGCTLEEAAALLGLHRHTIMRWRALGATAKRGKFKAFFDLTEDARAKATAAHLLNITKAATQGTWQASAWYLERTQPLRFGLRVRMYLHEAEQRCLDALPAQYHEAVREAFALQQPMRARATVEVSAQGRDGGKALRVLSFEERVTLMRQELAARQTQDAQPDVAEAT